MIVPTIGTRIPQLKRALESALEQRNCSTYINVVINGNRYDRNLEKFLSFDRRITLSYLRQPSVSQARSLGVRKTNTEFFAFLDDDDELLPHALETRLDVLQDLTLDLVVTDGFYKTVADLTPFMEHPPHPANDLALAILRENWLASAGALFRSGRIEEKAFYNLP
ncbi:MAG: glycosyltransferase family 2 protein [Nitrococcus sp.]|nr:glycosyltransferase family 2 protein [Nitrococcus sp.]